LRKPGWTQHSKVVTEFILKHNNFVMQTYILYEQISDYFYVHALVEFRVKVLDTF